MTDSKKPENKDVLLNHAEDNDGIDEYDNDLPSWYMVFFWATVIFGVLYMLHFHVFKTGDLPYEKYEKEMNPQYAEQSAGSSRQIFASLMKEYASPVRESSMGLNQLQIDQLESYFKKVPFETLVLEAMLKASPEDLEKLRKDFPTIYQVYTSEWAPLYQASGTAAPEPAEIVDEKNIPAAIIEPLTEESKLAAGKKIFLQNCYTCHGTLGEGGIGPNLTDDYWLHGNTFNDILTVIHKGVPAKGMISWEKQLKENQILEVASYITTLRGTNPPGAKAPQGKKYTLLTEEE